MKKIDKEQTEYYLTRLEMTGLTFGQGRKWLDKFEIGDILHIKEPNGTTTTMEVQLVKQLNFIV